MLATKGDHHQVQELRADEDGKDHRGHLGRFPHDGAQNLTTQQHVAAVEDAEHREEIGTIGCKEGHVAFKGHLRLVDAQIKVDANQDHHNDREARPDDQLAGFLLICQTAIGRQQQCTPCPKRRGWCWVGDTTKDGPEHRHDQNQRWEHHAQEFVLGQEAAGIGHAIAHDRKWDHHQDHGDARAGRWRDQEKINQEHQRATGQTDVKPARICTWCNTACGGQNQSEENNQRRDTRANRRGRVYTFRKDRRAFFVGQLGGFFQTALRVNRRLLSNSFVPGQLTMQINHRGFTLVRYSGPQRRRFATIREAVHNDGLAADHIDG